MWLDHRGSICGKTLRLYQYFLIITLQVALVRIMKFMEKHLQFKEKLQNLWLPYIIYNHVYVCTYVPYTAKLLRGKTFAVVHKTHHSLENFHGASGPCHYVLYTANDSRGKLSRLAKNHESFPLRKFCRIRYII